MPTRPLRSDLPRARRPKSPPVDRAEARIHECSRDVIAIWSPRRRVGGPATNRRRRLTPSTGLRSRRASSAEDGRFLRGAPLLHPKRTRRSESSSGRSLGECLGLHDRTVTCSFLPSAPGLALRLPPRTSLEANRAPKKGANSRGQSVSIKQVQIPKNHGPIKSGHLAPEKRQKQRTLHCESFRVFCSFNLRDCSRRIDASFHNRNARRSAC